MTSRLAIPPVAVSVPIVLATLFCASQVRAATPEQVEAALQKAKAGLYAKMDKEKFWEDVPKRDEADKGGASIKGDGNKADPFYKSPVHGSLPLSSLRFGAKATARIVDLK
jgi:hypothetical protein